MRDVSALSLGGERGEDQKLEWKKGKLQLPVKID